MCTIEQDADHLQAFFDQLADYHESQVQFVERVYRYRQWLREYRAFFEAYIARKQAQVHARSQPSTILAAPSDVTDAQWERVAPILHIPQKAGRRYVDARRTLNGIRYVLSTGCGWNHMPERYGNYVTCWRRLVRWQKIGVWAIATRILNAD